MSSQIAKTTDQTNTTTYQPGDYIVVRRHGVIQINGITKITVERQPVEVYQAYVAREELRLMIPVENIEQVKLRDVCSRDEIMKALKTVKVPAKRGGKVWIQRARDLEAKLRTGQVVDLIYVLANTFSANGDQSGSEIDLHRKALAALSSEVAAVLEMSTDEAEDYILEKIAKKAPKSTAA